MSCSDAAVAFIATVRSPPAFLTAPTAPIEQMPLVTILYPSLRRTVRAHERGAIGPMCMYLVAEEADEALMVRAAELQRWAKRERSWLAMRRVV